MSALQALLDKAINGILGPVMVGAFLSCAVTGVVVSLAALYTTRFPHDRPAFKALVGLLTALAVVDTAVQAWWGYRVAVVDFAQPFRLQGWPVQFTVWIFVGTAVGICQAFFIWRSWVISVRKSYVLTAVQSAICIASVACSYAFGHWTTSKYVCSLVWPWLSTGLFLDCLTTASIVYYMIVQPKKLTGTSLAYSSPLMRIITQSFQANGISLVLHAILLGLMGFSLQHWSMHYVIPGFCESKIYIASVITALNARSAAALEGSTSYPSEAPGLASSARRTKGFGARPSTAGAVSVQHETDVFVEVDVEAEGEKGSGMELESVPMRRERGRMYAVAFEGLERRVDEAEKGMQV
ncbi:hypothetical protein JCM8097_001416 [Rhodosporidiobolus ruineniae]